MSASLNALIPQMQPWAKALVDIAARAGIQPRVTSTLRSHSFQARLYRRFLAGQSNFPVAPPGASAHEFGYAFDMVVSPYDLELFKELGQVWTGWGGIWGGEFNDPIHFEFPGFHAPATSHVLHTIAEAADIISSFVPGIGEVELAAALLKLGFPQSEVLDFLSGPLTYLTK